MQWPDPDPRALALFQRRFAPAPGADLRALTALSRALGQLPYENLTKLLRLHSAAEPSPRRPLQVMQDHLELGTGGTCFSLTELLRQLVQARGLSCHPVMAHMRHGANIHCALLVELGGQLLLVDPGYLLSEPLALDLAQQPSAPWPQGAPRLLPAGALPGAPATLPAGELDLFTMEPGGPTWRYRLELRPPSAEAFQEHWLHSFDQPAMRSLLVTRRRADGTRLYLHNHRLRLSGPAGRENRNLRRSLDHSVAQLFGIDPRITREARAVSERLRRRRAIDG